MVKSAIAVAAVLASGADAFWRLPCPGIVGHGRIDPIVNPGEPSTHSHALHGGSAISIDSTSDDLLKSDCTSCQVSQDKSAYWAPQLYFKDASTGEYENVQQSGGMLVYYLLYGNNITAFPHGFRMLSGDPERRSYTLGDPQKADPDKSQWEALGQSSQSDLAQRALGFNCLNYGKAAEGTLDRHFLPDKEYLDANCANGIRMELMFPSCWDGKSLDSDNHKDHVAFPDLVMDGTCPPSHPARLPSLMFETIFMTYEFKGRNGKFVLSTNDDTGYSYHGDFVMGWEKGFLQKAVDTCTDLSGTIQSCPLFDIIDEGTATSCKMNKPTGILGTEDVMGPMMKLPGGKHAAKGGNSDKPKASYKAGDKPTNPAEPLPGNVFKETSAAAKPSQKPAAIQNLAAKESAAAPPPPPAVTPVPEAAAAEKDDGPYSTQYVTKGNVVNEILWKQDVVTVTRTAGAAPTPAAKRAARHARLHRRGHHF